MKLTRTLQVHPLLFNVIPFVNVIFLVLIFFAMSSRFVLQPGMALTLPASSFSLALGTDAQIISITAAPIPAIYHRQERVTFDELQERLVKSGGKQRSIIIKADQGTPYQLVMEITNAALKLDYSVILATASETR